MSDPMNVGDAISLGLAVLALIVATICYVQGRHYR